MVAPLRPRSMLDSSDGASSALRRGGAALARGVVCRAESRGGLAGLFAVGLALRLLLAPRGGVPFDLDTFAGWAQRLARTGPNGFYAQPGLSDYPPGYLYVLWAIGRLTGVG